MLNTTFKNKIINKIYNFYDLYGTTSTIVPSVVGISVAFLFSSLFLVLQESDSDPVDDPVQLRRPVAEGSVWPCTAVERLDFCAFTHYTQYWFSMISSLGPGRLGA